MTSVASSTTSKFKHLFVYGTLKKGYTNYTRYLKHSKKLGRAKFISPAITVEKYPLILRPTNRLPNTRGPILMTAHQEDKSKWYHIEGELWKVDEITMKALDILEGVNRTNQYHHENIQVIHKDNNNIINDCTCYFYTTLGMDDELLKITPLLPSYDDKAHNEYKPPNELNTEILKTIYTDTITCKRCKQKYVNEYNTNKSCKHHSESYAGETKQRWQLPGDTDGSAEIHFFYSCCGNYDENSEGCHTSKHISYDEDDTILYKEYD